jgi:hypothetical protein
MQLAEAWYSPTSASFWADVIALATIIATVIVGRQALPRRRLNCTIVSRSRLMNAPRIIRDNLKVSYGDRLLTDPYVVALEIASTGRSAIPSSSFDKDRSLQLRLEAQILTLLSTEYEPISATKPTINTDGEIIEFRPELIARREVIKLSLLTEGIVGNATVALNPFSDVKVEVKDREATESRRRKWFLIVPLIIGLLAIAATTTAAYLTVRYATNRTDEVAGSTLCLTIVEFAHTTELALELADRDIIVNRASNGRIHSVKFTSSYDSDVAEFKQDAQYLVTGYKAFNDSETKRLSVDINHVISILPVLPKEGTGGSANRDLAQVGGLLSQMTNPNFTVVPKTACS